MLSVRNFRNDGVVLEHLEKLDVVRDEVVHRPLESCVMLDLGISCRLEFRDRIWKALSADTLAGNSSVITFGSCPRLSSRRSRTGR